MCTGVHSVEVLVLSRHVDRAGGAAGCAVRHPLRVSGVLPRLVLRAVPALLRHRDAVLPSLLRGTTSISIPVSLYPRLLHVREPWGKYGALGCSIWARGWSGECGRRAPFRVAATEVRRYRPWETSEVVDAESDLWWGLC